MILSALLFRNKLVRQFVPCQPQVSFFDSEYSNHFVTYVQNNTVDFTLYDSVNKNTFIFQSNAVLGHFSPPVSFWVTILATANDGDCLGSKSSQMMF